MQIKGSVFVQILDCPMADDAETGSLLDRKLNNSSSPPPYSTIQSISSPAFNRNGLSQRCSASSPATNISVARAPLLDDRVMSAVIRSVPPLERALSVPDSHDNYVNFEVLVDESGRGGRAGRGSLKAARRSDSARSERTPVLAAENAEEQKQPLTSGSTTTRRRAKLQHSFGSMHRAGSGTSINLSRKSYERLTGLELPPSPVPNDVPITPDTPIIVTVTLHDLCARFKVNKQSSSPWRLRRRRRVADLRAPVSPSATASTSDQRSPVTCLRLCRPSRWTRTTFRRSTSLSRRRRNTTVKLRCLLLERRRRLVIDALGRLLVDCGGRYKVVTVLTGWEYHRAQRPLASRSRC